MLCKGFTATRTHAHTHTHTHTHAHTHTRTRTHTHTHKENTPAKKSHYIGRIEVEETKLEEQTGGPT